MTSKEYILIFLTLVCALVPGVFTYHFLTANPAALARLEGQTDAAAYLAATAVAEGGREVSRVSEIYDSRPQKDALGVCVNSYYTSFVLVILSDGTFLLTKHCESARDPVRTWYGNVSGWAAAGTSSEEVRDVSVLGDEMGSYPAAMHVVLGREENGIRVLSADLDEIATTTAFVFVPHAIPRVSPDVRATTTPL